MFLLMLAVLLGFLTYICFTVVINIYQEKKEISKKIDINIFKTFNEKGELENFIVMIVVTIVLFVGFCFSFFGFTNSSLFEDKTPSKWNSLTKEEKQWYKDNYGGGKGQEIQDAIDKYKNK